MTPSPAAIIAATAPHQSRETLFGVHLSGGWQTVVIIALVFFAASLAARWSDRLAESIVRRHERRHLPDAADSGIIRSLRRRETMVSLTRTTVRYVTWGVALVVAFAELTQGGRGGAVLGASLLVVLIGFALQRLLIDLIQGALMIFEGWFDVGDTITVEPFGLTGVVEETSLRSTVLRTISGETVRVNNSQIGATRVMRRGVRDVQIEVFVSDEHAGQALIEEVARLMPVGPTYFHQPPVVEHVRGLDDQLFLVQARASLVPEREWLATEFFPQVLKERAPEGLIVHGPVVMDRDARAEARYARAFGILTDEPAEPAPESPMRILASTARRRFGRRQGSR